MKEKYANEILKKSRSGYKKIAHDFASTRKVFWQELYFLGDLIQDGMSVLDIGCGNGRFLEVVGHKNITYVGVDNVEEFITLAKQTYGNKGTFLCADALALPFEDSRFDVAVSFGVLHHIPSKKLRKQFLKEAHRVLKKDGLLLLTVWNLWNKRITPIIRKYAIQKLLLRSQLDFKDIFLPFGKEKDIRYLHAFTKRKLRKLLSGSGFQVQEIQRVKRRGENENIVAVCRKNQDS